MTDPERLLSSRDELLPDERELLEQLRDVEPKQGAMEAIWPSLSATMGAGGVTAGGAKSATFKMLAGGLVVVGAAAVWVGVHPNQTGRQGPLVVASQSAVPVSARPSEQSAVPLVSTPEGSTTSAAKSEAAPLSDSKPKATAAPAASALREEIEAVRHARATLRAGSVAQALRELDAMRARFPSGTLAQEREALTIEALAQSGRLEEARTRALSFSKAHPDSPHSPRLDALLRDKP